MLLPFETYCTEPTSEPGKPGSKWISYNYMNIFKSYFADSIYSLFACMMAYCSPVYYNPALVGIIQEFNLLPHGIHIYKRFCIALHIGSPSTKFEVPPNLLDMIAAFQAKTNELNIRQKAVDVADYFDQIYRETLDPMRISPSTSLTSELIVIEDIAEED